LGLLALVIGGCSSKSSNNDSSVNDAGSDVRADTATVDVKADTVVADHGPDLAVDHGFDVPRADVRDTNGSICTGTPPNGALIDDFANATNSAFGQPGIDPVFGGTYVKAAGLDAEDFTANSWHLTGTVTSRHDLFGIYWNCTAAVSGGCTLDASAYAGIQFTIKGTVGPANAIGFTLGRADDDTPPENATCGTCVVPADAATSEDACHGPRTTVTVPTDGTTRTVTLHWADLTGGSPNQSADPHQLTGILWYFHDPVASDGGTDAGAADAGDGAVSGPSYHVDLTIDDVTFVSF
jgi:hypothetical protein